MANSEHDAMTSEAVREQLTKIAQECGLNPLWCMDALEQVWQAALSTQSQSELEALRKHKKAVDLAFTAGMLAMSGEVGFKIPCHEFVTSMKVAFRQAETDYMNEFGSIPAPPAKPQEGK